VPSLLFAYGTLMPCDRASARRDGWHPDAVRGRLFDLGPYPALIDLDDPEAGWVEGFVRPVDLAELETRLDPWEEVERGLYGRTETVTRACCRVWVYVYNRPLPPHARGPMARWDGPRRAPAWVGARDEGPGASEERSSLASRLSPLAPLT
jgi:indolepyruvate decarboxylase